MRCLSRLRGSRFYNGGNVARLSRHKEMYAGYIAVKRKDARVSMYKIAQIAGCSPAEYSAYEHERKEFDPEVYRKCVEYLKA